MNYIVSFIKSINKLNKYNNFKVVFKNVYSIP